MWQTDGVVSLCSGRLAGPTTLEEIVSRFAVPYHLPN
jgi:hypothetical protein